MAPILGIYASQISGHLFAPSGAYDSIATTTVGAGGASSITFSSIPSTYTHLQLRMMSIGNALANNSGTMAFNSDTTGSNYYTHYIIGNGATITADSNNANFTPFTVGVAASPAVGIIDIFDYANTNKYKTVRELNGYDANGSGRMNFDSVLWSNTAAINSITLSFSTFQQNSSFALYGIKGS
jgi:hypothetical protein